MKHIIYTAIITLLLVQIMAMKQSNEQPVPIYNRILNQKLTHAIKAFVEKHKSEEIDKNSKFINLFIRRDSIGYHIVISYMPDSAHNSFVRHPIIICKPIAGKKVFVNHDLDDLFISPNIPESSLYFKDDCPKAYQNYTKRYNDLKWIINYVHGDNKDILDYTHDRMEYKSPSLHLTFDYNHELTDSVYCKNSVIINSQTN